MVNGYRLGLWGCVLTIMGVVLAAEVPATGESTLYLEAERFDDVGEWTIDGQFRQIMGSTYLLAVGIGEPVEDAVTKAETPRGGTYRLWVRCKDGHETSPGKFQVFVNGKPSATTFGAQKKGWAWIPGGASRTSMPSLPISSLR